MNSLLAKQRGMTGLGWLTVLALIGFFSLLVLKLAPVYLDHYSVASTVRSLETEPLITRKSTGEIRKLLKKRLKINYVSDLPKDAIKIKKSGGVLKVDVEYHVDKPFFGNIDFRVHFKEHIELIAH